MSVRKFKHTIPRTVHVACALFLWAGCMLAASRPVVLAQAYSEYEVKAAFLFKFTKFVEWPAPEDPEAKKKEPFRIGILGDDPFGDALDNTVKDEAVLGRQIAVVRGQALDDLGPCELLFLSRSFAAEAKNVLDALKESHTLTVSDMDGFLDKGGMIHLDLDGKRVLFRINDDAALAAHLKISSQLLQLAKEVRRTVHTHTGVPRNASEDKQQ